MFYNKFLNLIEFIVYIALNLLEFNVYIAIVTNLVILG